LLAIERMSRKDRVRKWGIASRRAITLECVKRKMRCLARGVQFCRISGSRTAQAKHAGHVRQAMRFIRGEIHGNYAGKRQRSYLIERKVRIHLIIKNPRVIKVWDRLPLQRISVQPTGAELAKMKTYPNSKKILEVAVRMGAQRKAAIDVLLKEELVTAFSCSHAHLFGSGA
jgi:hypothetical protein